ncbi:hypothetical protein O7599_15295 [Streptomyces sp. WMMC500]|uniref:hypothetical protein n=1 Tax=Streptomyces sp. WMMC500 TaxID=3015154 RepID=UPI00248B196D|nr:hypothetical protein [Streptomyces sp. WMMC500]WBB63798.1 hypothetical protein O7599_15295 [Streptomyces sp. WMMC500]
MRPSSDRPVRTRVRAAAGALCAVLTAGTLAVGVPPPPARADAAADLAAARSASRWLEAQLADDGTIRNPLGGALPDHGLMIDVLFALHASGDGELAEPVAAYLDEGKHASDYFTWDGLVPDQGYDAVITGGAAAKTLVAAEVSGRDPRDFGGYDMVAETQGAIMRSGPDKGRVSDYSKDPDLADFVSNNANMFGQALAVIGLAGVDENDRLALDTLLAQQCSEGYFRIFFGYVPTDETGDHVTEDGRKLSTCDEGKEFGQSAPDGDATGLALSALLAAREAGATGLEGPIGRTVAWLKGRQDAGGGWGGGVSTEAPNTNSTGLIVQALAEAGGAGAAVGKGAAYLASAQATEADAGGVLGEHVGAIAYTPAEYEAARTGGIVGLDTWVRASAQASLGLARTGFYELTQGDSPPGGGDPHEPNEPGNPNEPGGPNGPGGPGGSDDPPAGGGGTPGGKGGTGGGSGGPGASGDRGAPDRDGDPDTGRPAPPPGSTGGTPVEPAADSSRPAPDTPAGRLGRYLADRLVDGDHVEVTQDGRRFVDYDATADLVLALLVLGEQPEAAARAARFLLAGDSVAAYAHGVPYEDGPAAYAEPLAKLRVVAGFRLGGTDAPAGAPTDAAATAGRLDADLAELRTDEGRFADTGVHGDKSGSTQRHAWAAVATAADPDSAAAAGAALDVLAEHQCADGTFPEAMLPGEDDCASGDLAATAAATVALNARASNTAGQPAADRADGAQSTAAPDGGDGAAASGAGSGGGAPGEGPADGSTPGGGAPGAASVPDDWSPQRLDALTAAATALNTAPGDNGLVRKDTDPDSAPDVVLSALVAGGRQAAGLDATATARALGAMLRADGGMAAAPGERRSDPRTSAAVAPGVAGASWTSAPGSPVAPAVTLPAAAALAEKAAADERAQGHGGDDGLPGWALAALVTAAALGTAAAAYVVVRHLNRIRTRRNDSRKAVTA